MTPRLAARFQPVLRIDVDDIKHVTPVASDLRRWNDPGTYKPLNVDFSREYRYCLETGASPVPARAPTTLRIEVPEPEFARDQGIRTLKIDGEPIEGAPATVTTTVAERVNRSNPHVLVLIAAAIVPALFEAAPGDPDESSWDDDQATSNSPGGRRSRAMADRAFARAL